MRTTHEKRPWTLDLTGAAKLDCDQRDQQVVTIRIMRADGTLIAEIARATYHSDGLCVYAPAPPELEQGYRVTGTLAGIAVDEWFSELDDASKRVVELGDAGSRDAEWNKAERPIPEGQG